MTQRYTKSLECTCVRKVDTTVTGVGGIKAHLGCKANLKTTVTAVAKLQSRRTYCYPVFKAAIARREGFALNVDTNDRYRADIVTSGFFPVSGAFYNELPQKGDKVTLFDFYGHPQTYDIQNYSPVDLNQGVYKFIIDYSNSYDKDPSGVCGSELYINIARARESETNIFTCSGEFCIDRVRDPHPIWVIGTSGSIVAVGDISSKLSGKIVTSVSMSGVGLINNSGMTAQYSVTQEVANTGSLVNTYTDKFRGSFSDYTCLEILYPSGDKQHDPSFGGFITASGSTSGLYDQIDEGVFIGDYDKQFGISTRLADDDTTYITPSAYKTEGEYQYKGLLSTFRLRPDESRLRIRASAPLANYESRIAPRYTLHNIKFQDPSGNLLIQYEDIVLKGDTDYTNPKTFKNYTTYSLKPIENIFDKYDWERRYVPHTNEIYHYILTFDVKVEALDDPFDVGYDIGFEEKPRLFVNEYSKNDYLALDGAPLSTQDQSLINPTKNIRISAVEICNSGLDTNLGSSGPRPEDYINFFLQVPEKGRRLERKILPSFLPLADVDNRGIFPAVSSIWDHQHILMGKLGDNLDKCGADQIIKALRTDSYTDYTDLNTTGPHLDSGKLIMKFSHGPSMVTEVTPGAFHCGFDQNMCPIWWEPSGAFNTENKRELEIDDGYFEIESITLKVLAKKENADSRDFVLDVVGFSDDGLLNVTSAQSGFLQNPESVQLNDQVIYSEGTHPVTSGLLKHGDDLGISTESLSEKDKYLETSGNLGGDHYELTRYPLVQSTEFKEYEVPLQIYDNYVELGLPRKHNISSMFEHLYLDIYPIPSGAAIASAYLLVRYKPQNALKLMTQGGECIRAIQDGRSEGAIFPTTRQVNDDILNAGSGYGLISKIDNIPHAYTTPSSIKTNYARRWRGMKGVVRGPYDPDMFGFGFENPHVDFPFMSGFYDFDNIDGTRYVTSRDLGNGLGGASGLFNTDIEKYRNVGLRFDQGNMFTDQLPGFSHSHKTSNWTALSNGGTNFESDHLYNKIVDAFNNVVRISGYSQNINFGNIDTGSGFSIFSRFTPDANITGVDYNLFNSGVIFSKWTDANDLDFALGYDDGFLCGYAKDFEGNIITVKDTVKYSGYMFPLSVLLTYNDHNSSGLKLYTDNELNSDNWNTLRASSVAFRKNHTDADLVVGHCQGSGVGMNMLLSEFGISTYGSGVDTLLGSGTNLVESNADLTYKQVTAQSFLEGHRAKFFQPEESYTNDSYKLPSYVDENPFVDWSLGDFNFPAFTPAFSSLGSAIGKRTNRDLISFHLKSSGTPYVNQNGVSLDNWPSTVSSGVCYHTQIENDFLRFNLSDAADNFYAIPKRITKDLPRGYVFGEEALVVETILDHKISGDIVWDGCSDEHHGPDPDRHGPKLIVSLYTKRQEPYWIPDEPNWGLVNRDIHYLAARSGMIMTKSKFTYDNFFDTSEAWSLFPDEPRLTEFTEKYYSQDIDDMFLQYDLVYPSGGAFESDIHVHTSHVRLDDAFVQCTDNSGVMNLMSSGGNVVDSGFNLFAHCEWMPISGQTLNLNVGVPQTHSVQVPSGMPLFASGSFREHQSLNLNILSTATINSGVNLYTSGEFRELVGPSGDSLNLAIRGHGESTEQMPLVVRNSDLSYIPSGGMLPLFTYATDPGKTGIRDYMPLYITNNQRVDRDGPPALGVSNFPLFIYASNQLIDTKFDQRMPLVIYNDNRHLSGILPLVAFAADRTTNQISSTADGTNNFGDQQLGMNLYIPNYGGVGSPYFNWFNLNVGTGIEQKDNVYATIPIDNEIRGVTTVGFGECVKDPALRTDETDWRPDTCENGGIFRAIDTYTNSGALNFGGQVGGYSGNYYAIRKYTNLIPNAPYFATLKITTGQTEPIKVPRDFEDWEYGICGPDFYPDSGCCTADCDQNLVYSGLKLTGDAPYLSGIQSMTPASGRNPNDNYGACVAVTDDLMAVAATKMDITDEEDADHIIEDAGSVFVYRRGEDVAGKKAYWEMEDKLTLPSGYKRDYVVRTMSRMINYNNEFFISGQQWGVGQEGRQFGSSMDIGVSGANKERETIIIGAPRAKWTRQFPDVVTSGIPVGIMIFVDTFEPKDDQIKKVVTAGKRWDLLYKYFSAPWHAQTDHEFNPRLDVKVIVFEVAKHDDEKRPRSSQKYKDSFRHVYLPRLDDMELRRDFGARNVFNEMVSGIKKEFFDLFPTPQFGPHSGIPPILGIFAEESHSTMMGGAFKLNEESVIDEFQDFYNLYSERSGVINPEVPEAARGYVRRTDGPSEEWYNDCITLINDTLPTGNLAGAKIYGTDHDVMSFITSGFGQEWAKNELGEFQNPPPSGGRAYIFEKERGKFNLVQEIVSNSERSTSEDDISDRWDYDVSHNDRFGHSVAISKDTTIASIGSPFTDSPCEIFQRDDSETTRMYNGIRDWLTFIGRNDTITRYDELLTASGAREVQDQIYHELNQSDKFRLRIDQSFWGGIENTIQLYKPIYRYGYGDIGSTGTWRFILDEFAGTSRLGYSTSVSDDGRTVAFGAPTDSMNLFEDTNVWYEGKETWASYTNAGAVRIFESKRYTPHSGVVEFSRFGNLDRAMHPTEREAGYYDQMELYFKPDNNNQGRPFRKMEFEEIEIPSDAGLAFIITPELDAASDEIVENIKNWLALGDRTLVLVGNDPVWEENGLYADSNAIINKLLKKLGSRMTIIPADTEYESLNGAGNRFQEPDGCVSPENTFNDKWNVTKAFLPDYAHTTYSTHDSQILKPNIFAKGVGSIKVDLSDLDMEEFNQFGPCDDENGEYCSLPIRHLGDPRAQWNSKCQTVTGFVKYKTNWGFHFSNPNPAVNCKDYPEDPRPAINRPYEDVVPILTAAEWLPDIPWYVPAESGYERWRERVDKYVCYDKYRTICEFAQHNIDEVAFSLKEDEESIFTGDFAANHSLIDYSFKQNKGGFIDPPAENSRDGILKGVGDVFEKIDISTERVLLSNRSALAVRESYYTYDTDGTRVDKNNDVYLIASVLGENNRSFEDGGISEDSGGNSDQNILFYINMLKNSCSEAPTILQLGGWTKRTSFADAYDRSILFNKLSSFLNDPDTNSEKVIENGVYGPGQSIPAHVDVVWIANPDGQPADSDVTILKSWLALGDKKVVITYAGYDTNKRQAYAQNVAVICEKLGLDTRPWSYPCKGGYHVGQGDDIYNGNLSQCCPYGQEEAVQQVNSDSDPFKGCANGYCWNPLYSSYCDKVNTKVDKVSLRWDEESSFDEVEGTNFSYIPLSGGKNAEDIIWYNTPIYDACPVVDKENIWFIDGSGVAEFQGLPGSGYRIWVNWVSETQNEQYPIRASIENVHGADCRTVDELDCDDSSQPYYFGEDGGGVGGANGKGGLTTTLVGVPEQAHLDVRACKSGKIEILFNTDELSSKAGGIVDDEGNPSHDPAKGFPQTVRVLSISGALLPIEKTVLQFKKCRWEFDYWIYKEKYWYRPARSGVTPGKFRPIKHESLEYCPPNGDCPPRGENEIEDGPIVAAEEFEHFSAGAQGHRRSKIVLLSDSTMIQGQCSHYRNDSLGENQAFIRSLYPISPDKRTKRELGFSFTGGSDAQFKFVQKLRAPERGSPAKYHAVTGITNMIAPLYSFGTANTDLSKYVDNEDTYHPASPGFTRKKNPPTPKLMEEKIEEFGTEAFAGGAATFGLYPRFSGDFLNQGTYNIDGQEREYLLDARQIGGLPDLMKINGTDYLDLDIYTSGCLGDLFGFSVDLTNDKLVVGTPFNGYHTEHAVSGVSGIVQWHEILNDPSKSGLKLSQNGGAGSAFFYERTGSGTNVVSEFLPWEFKEKLKPSSVNVGIDNATITQLFLQRGNNNLSSDFILNNAGRTDQYGYSVAIDADMIAVGAPNHDFETLHHHIYSGTSAFQRKSFNGEYEIPAHVYYDLGSSGIRIDRFNSLSGTLVLNHGAVFNYRHSLTDFANRQKSWIYGEKLISHGHHARSGSIYTGDFLTFSGCENDNFGKSVSMFRSKRGDSDYTLAVGAPFHDHAISGNHHSSGVDNAGAAYSYDAMLREQIPAIPNSGGFIDVEIFGGRPQLRDRKLARRIYQNTTGGPITYLTSGIIFANADGDIFIEGSGFDPSAKGFVAHRPFVESVVGDVLKGDEATGSLDLFISGVPRPISGELPLTITGPDQATVYNIMNLNTFGISGNASGALPMFMASKSGETSGILNLSITSTQVTENLNLRLRGK